MKKTVPAVNDEVWEVTRLPHQGRAIKYDFVNGLITQIESGIARISWTLAEPEDVPIASINLALMDTRTGKRSGPWVLRRPRPTPEGNPNE